jgi:hypothetical protein
MLDVPTEDLSISADATSSSTLTNPFFFSPLLLFPLVPKIPFVELILLLFLLPGGLPLFIPFPPLLEGLLGLFTPNLLEPGFEELSGSGEGVKVELLERRLRLLPPPDPPPLDLLPFLLFDLFEMDFLFKALAAVVEISSSS